MQGDVDGSVEAILTCLDTYSSQEVLLDIVTFGIGQVSPSPPPPPHPHHLGRGKEKISGKSRYQLIKPNFC